MGGPAWLERYGLKILRWGGRDEEGDNPLEKATLLEIQSLNDRLALAEATIRDLDSRRPAEHGTGEMG